MSLPTDICACGHPRSAHTMNQVQRFTDGSARRRLCAEAFLDLRDLHAWPCMCDLFMRPLDGNPDAKCSYCRHPRLRHAVDGCHATTEGVPWRPGDCRCNCDKFPGQPTFHRWKLHRATSPHARCATAGHCVEHAANSEVVACR